VKAWIIGVQASSSSRYFDSIWVQLDNAESRKTQLQSEFSRAGLSFMVGLFAVDVLDGQVREKGKAVKS
jgi:hypothetical protein